jgi:hypothetical protein
MLLKEFKMFYILIIFVVIGLSLSLVFGLWDLIADLFLENK